MKHSQLFNSRIGALVDTYQGSVPLARLLLEAHRLEMPSSLSGRPTLYLQPDEEGNLFLITTFSDGSEVTLAVTEEF